MATKSSPLLFAVQADDSFLRVDTTGWPQATLVDESSYIIRVDNEEMRVVATWPTGLRVLRGVAGTTKAWHASGSAVRYRSADGTLDSLVARIRRGIRQDIASAYTLSAVTPTVTLGPQGTPGSQIAGSVVTRPLQADNTDSGKPYRYLGGLDLAFGTSGVDVNQIRPRVTGGSGSIVLPPYSVRFGFSGDTKFEIRTKAVNNSSFRVRIDDRWVTESETAVGGTAGQIYGIQIGGLDAGPHIYQLDLRGIFWFGGIYCIPGATLWKPAGLPVKAVLISDSTGAGATGLGSGGAYDIATWWVRFCDLLGVEGYNVSVGGTGMIASPGQTFGERFTTDVTNQNPDLIVISGSRNDNGSSISAITAAATALYQKAKDENPQALILAMGPEFSTSSPAASYINCNTATRAAALAVGIPFIDMYTGDTVMGDGSILTNDGGQWITGTGFLGSTNGTGNADIYIGADDVHPTFAGHQYWARRAYTAVKAIIDSL